MVIRMAERELETRFGPFNEILYNDGRSHAIALVMGDVENASGVVCRVHSSCIGGHVFNSVECECAAEMAAAQAAVQSEGKGVIIYLDQEGRGNGHLALMLSIPFKKSGMSQGDAYVAAGFRADARDYRAAAGVLNDLRVRSIILLTGNPEKAKDLSRLGIDVVGTRDLFPKS